MTDAPVHYVHEEKADGFGTVRIRPVDAEADAAVLHGWVSAERASFWGMNGLTRDQVAEVYAHMAYSTPTTPTSSSWTATPSPYSRPTSRRRTVSASATRSSPGTSASMCCSRPPGNGARGRAGRRR